MDPTRLLTYNIHKKVFFRGRVAIQAAQVVRTRQARAASDHLPVVVDFSLPRN